MPYIFGLIILSIILNKIGEDNIMAKVAELLEAIIEERAEIKASLDQQKTKINDLLTLVQQLQDQISNNQGAITEEQLDEVKAAIQNIHTPEDDV